MRILITASVVLALLFVGWFVISNGRLDANPADNALRAARSEEELIRVAVQEYKKAAGRVPTAHEGLEVLHKSMSGGPYLRDTFAFTDPWGTPYRYVPNEDGQEFALYSAGPNKVDEKGGGDDVR